MRAFPRTAFTFLMTAVLAVPGLSFLPAAVPAAHAAVDDPVPLGVAGNWSLAFDDEFSGTSLDTSRWTALSETVNSVHTSPANVSESGGYLNLTLSGSATGAAVCSGTPESPCCLTACGAAVPNGGKLLPGGYAEARVWFAGSGNTIDNWPAWWVSGPNWPASGEIDTAEGLGPMTTSYHGTSNTQNGIVPSGNYAASWHTYGVYRHASSDDVYWDGVLVKTFPTGDSGVAESPILNVGGGWGPAVYGAGSAMQVDYVRIWNGA